MKSSLVVLFFLKAIFSPAQECSQNFTGTKTLYQPQQLKFAKPPKGYEPVFINHVGRHGARHLTKDVNTSFAYALLEKADKMQGLTDDGKKIQQMLLLLEKIEKKNFKSISDEGKKELEGIAERMYRNNENVFIAKAPIQSVEVTKEKRTGQSGTVFLNKLKTLLNQNNPTEQLINDTTLRFFDISPSYLNFEKKGSWQQSLQHLKQSNGFERLIDKTIHLFFTTSFITTINKDESAEFLADIFGFITILPSINKEITDAGYEKQQLNFQSFFTCEELVKLGLTDDAEDFLLKGPGSDGNGIQVKIAAPLLMDFITSTDDFISKGGITTKLRFAHAETIAPFAALLGIHGASTPAASIDSFQHFWKASEIVPLSANIQWILYKKKGIKNLLVKVLLNEKETIINGLATKTFPFYSWKKFRVYYLSKLKQAGLSPGDDFNQYLLKLN